MRLPKLSSTFFYGKKSSKKSQSQNITPILRQQHQLNICATVNSNVVILFYTSGKSSVLKTLAMTCDFPGSTDSTFVCKQFPQIKRDTPL